MRSKLTWLKIPAPIQKTLIVLSLLLIVFALTHASTNSQTEPVLSVAGTASQTYPGGETTYHIELNNVTLHFFEEEWEEFIELAQNLKR